MILGAVFNAYSANKLSFDGLNSSEIDYQVNKLKR